MPFVRRTSQIVALLGTLVIGVAALLVIILQTTWSKGFIRSYIVSEANQYLNGQLSIGRLSGNLFFGVELTDIAIDMDGERVISIKDAGLDYSVLDIIASGVVLDDVRLNKPIVRLRRTAEGWNLGRLVKKEALEARRRGPGRPVTVGEIGISDGTFTISNGPQAPFRTPERIDRVDASFSFEYRPVRFTIGLNHLSLNGESPELKLTELAGKIAVANRNLYLDDVVMHTAESELNVDGTVERTGNIRQYSLHATSRKFSMPEIGRVVPAIQNMDLQSSFDVTTSGPLDRLKIDLSMRSNGGDVAGAVTADLTAPERGVIGTVNLRNLNLAPILKNPSQKSRITGRAEVDLRIPAANPLGGLRGSYRFSGPEVAYLGYQGRGVRATGRIAGPRIQVDGRALAYGARASATGTVVRPTMPRDAWGYDLAGRASRLDLRRMPPQIKTPRLATNLDFQYRITGAGSRFSADARLHPSVVEGARLGEGTTAQFSSSGGPIVYTVDGDVSNLDVQRLGDKFKIGALASTRISSNINGRFTARGITGPAGRIEADMQLHESTLEGGTIAEGTTAHLLVDGDRIEYAATGRASNVDLQRLGRALNLETLAGERFAGRVSGPFSATGSGKTLQQLKLDASGVLTEATLFGARFPRLAFESHIINNSLRAKAQGDFSGLNPAAVIGDPRFAGKVSGTVDAEMSIGDLGAKLSPGGFTWNGRAVLMESTLAGLEIDRAVIDASYQNRVGQIREFSMTGPDVKANASGMLALDETSQSNLTYHIEAAELSKLRELLGQPLRGSVTADGTLVGNAAELRSQGTLAGSNIGYGNTEALSLNARYTFAVPDLDLVRATIGAESKAAFVTVSGHTINELSATTSYAGRQLQFSSTMKEGTRQLDASGDAIFHADHQEIHLRRLNLASQGVQWAMAPGSDAAIQYGKDQLLLKNVRLVSGNQFLNVAGSVGLRPGSTGTLDVEASNVDLAQIDKLLLAPQGLGGVLNASGRLTGSTDQPRFDGKVSIANGAIRGFPFESLTADLNYTQTGLIIDGRVQQSANAWLTAKGRVPQAFLRRGIAGAAHFEAAVGNTFDLRIQTNNIGLNLVQTLTPEITNVQGVLQADVHLGGSGQDPHLDGFVDIKGGAFQVPATGLAYTGLDTRIDLKPDRLVVRAFQVLDHHGNALSISGDLAIHERQIGGVRIGIRSAKFEVLDNELGTLELNTDLRLTGELRRPRLEGAVTFYTGRLEVDQILDRLTTAYVPVSASEPVQTVPAPTGAAGRTVLVTEKRQAAAQQPASGAATLEPGGLFEALALDVQLQIPNDLVIRGTDLRYRTNAPVGFGDVNVTVGGDLRLQKAAHDSVRIIGTVNTVRGAYEFQGRRFEILRDGHIRFEGLRVLDPSLDINARRIISGVEARIHLGGTFREPTLTLSSTPPLDEADILSLIVFNQPINSLGEGERVSLAQRAGELAGGFIASPLEESLSRALDLDIFEIETNTGTGPRLTLGEQVGPRLFLKFSQQFGPQDVSEFVLEYELADFLRLQTSISEGGTRANRSLTRRVERAGSDLIFFFSY